MDDQPQLKPTTLLRESFTFAVERLPEILKSQILYVVLLLLIAALFTYAVSDVNEHATQVSAAQAVEMAVQKSGGKTDMSMIDEETGHLNWARAKAMAVLFLLYLFGRSLINNLYEGLWKGTPFPRYTLFPVARNVVRLVALDLKITVGVLGISLGLFLFYIIVMWLTGNLSGPMPQWMTLITMTVLPLLICAVMVYGSLIFTSAQPSVYANTPVKLLGHFYPATRGFRWKIMVTKAGVWLPVIICNIGLRQLLTAQTTQPDFAIMLIGHVFIMLVGAGCLIWDVYINVMLWGHIAPRIRLTPAAQP